MTSADENGLEHGGDDFVAAEYVLGVLPAEERQATARRIESDAAFARLVDSWEVSFSALGAEFDEVEPPATVKSVLDSKLFSSARAAMAEPARGGGFWQSLALWRGIAGIAVAGLAVAVALFYVAPPGTQPTTTGPQGAQLAASLEPNDSGIAYLAVYDPARHQIGLSHLKGERPKGRDFELWVIQGKNAPASLGVIPAGSSTHLPVSGNVQDMIESGAVFAITAEPPGGAPEGKPTGPIVAKGNLSSI